MSSSTQRHCAFLTLDDRSDFYIYDHLLFEPLAALGWEAREIPWNQSGVNWGRFDAVIIRSTWDYQNHLEQFMATLAQISAETLLLNPLEVCRWNSHKSYLRDLSERGVAIVPSLWEPRLHERAIETAAQAFACDQLIVKPCVGANADDTFVLDLHHGVAPEQALATFSDRELIIQPFVKSVCSDGEHSLFFFGGEFSHAILKRPAAGDFRVQEEHGGVIQSTAAPAAMREAAVAALDAVAQPLLYARVDFLTLADGSPALIEMELIEPSLYFEQCAAAPAHFARVFNRMAS
jgi:glutathione synthase/RimK-type ligase-like ATP-grasp enzyme